MSQPEDSIIQALVDYAEGRMSLSDWQQWWAVNSEDVERQLGDFAFLRIKKRGYGGVIATLEDRGMTVAPIKGYCAACGEPLFRAIPGVTSKEEIKAFALRSKLKNREEISSDGWIHPGEYCPNGCSFVLYNVRRNP